MVLPVPVSYEACVPVDSARAGYRPVLEDGGGQALFGGKDGVDPRYLGGHPVLPLKGRRIVGLVATTATGNGENGQQEDRRSQ